MSHGFFKPLLILHTAFYCVRCFAGRLKAATVECLEGMDVGVSSAIGVFCSY